MSDSSASPYRVLARKYRPSTFAELIGQEAMVRTLTNAIRAGRLAHAFILTGVRGIGKTTTARLIARALNCEAGPTIEPCGTCEPCRAIAEDRHVDVLEMDAASRTGVGDIRELIEGVRYRPAAARYKVYIIDEVHMLSNQAFNALLKTLEEPPEHVKFIFATTEIRKIPVTVLSRCQRFDLRRVDARALSAHFAAIAERENAELEPEALAMIARAADGSVRDGLSLLDQAIAHAGGAVTAQQTRDMLGLADRARVVDLFEAVMKGDIAAALDQVAEQYALGADPAVVLQDMLEVTHWLTRLKLAPEAESATAPDGGDAGRGRDMARALSMAALTRAWQMLLKGLGEVRVAPAPLQAAEMVLVRLAYAADLPGPAEAVEALRKGTPPSMPGGGNGPSPAPPGGAATATAAARPSEAPAAGPRAALAPTPSAPSPEAPMPADFRALVALFEERREALLAAALRHNVHPVRFEPGRIDVRLTDHAPRDLANKVGTLLSRWTGRRWMVSVSGEPGEPTLAEQDRAAEQARHRAAAADPLVEAVLTTFGDMGARIAAVRDLGEAAPSEPLESTGEDDWS